MSSAVLSVPSAAQGGSLFWFFRALGVAVLVYLAFMGLLFTLLLCWAAHKCSKPPQVNIEALKRQHAKDAKALDTTAATLAVIKDENQMRRQQVINWNKYLVEEMARLEWEQNYRAWHQKENWRSSIYEEVDVDSELRRYNSDTDSKAE